MKFREASFDLLSDFLNILNKINKFKLRNVTKYNGNFQDARLTGKCVMAAQRFVFKLSNKCYQALQKLQKKKKHIQVKLVCMLFCFCYL